MLSEHLFFITERINDILKLEEDDERKGILSYPSKIRKRRITKSIQELHQELSQVVVYLRDVEQRSDEQQHDHDRFYRELRVIANSSDHILDSVFSNDVVNGIYKRVKRILKWVVGNDPSHMNIYHLVSRIRNCHHLLPSGPNYNINTGGNTNLSGQQIIGSTNIYIDPSHSRAPMINRISRPKTYGEYVDSNLVGFQHEIQTLLHHLTQDNEAHVMGIVGMGGLGKTTLAKHIYHHPNINTHFNHKAWVCISQAWDKTSIFNAISSQVLRDQSYLVVLDDIWSIEAWYDISSAFLPWSSGSKVVVTSRNIVVPKGMDRTAHIVEPKQLDDKESWELFKQKAFLPNESISHEQLRLGEKMVKECKGLPLAIVALAGVLGINKRPCYWERVSKTLTHNILKEINQSTQGVVKEVLALSYHELPHHLKQCVLYLRLFPEDDKINARKLMKMWIAEGLIGTNEEYTAEEYLDEIVQRYIVKVEETNFMEQVSIIRIHDLIRQMVVDIDKERGFLRDSLRLAAVSFKTIYGDVHNYNSSRMSESEHIANVERVILLEPSSHIRSVIFLSQSYLYKSAVLQSMFVKFRLLRVLIFHDIDNIPEEIENLIHLRYLELQGTVEQFPAFIGNLRNLQTINFRYVSWSRKAEINLCKLKELRHLYLSDDYRSIIGKLCVGGLEKLKTLCVGGGEWMLLGMTGLSVVLEELSVVGISSKEQLEVVFRTLSITSYNLQTLELQWDDSDDNKDVKLCDMNILRECQRLKKLKLCGKIQVGTDLIFPPNLIKLEMTLTDVKEREVMNIISESCPYLQILSFSSNAFWGKKLVCNAHSFPKLVKLTLFNLDYLRQWIIESTAMPSLHYLTIIGCPYLTLTPEGQTRILQIPQLTIRSCLHLEWNSEFGYVYRRSRN